MWVWRLYVYIIKWKHIYLWKWISNLYCDHDKIFQRFFGSKKKKSRKKRIFHNLKDFQILWFKSILCIIEYVPFWRIVEILTFLPCLIDWKLQTNVIWCPIFIRTQFRSMSIPTLVLTSLTRTIRYQQHIFEKISYNVLLCKLINWIVDELIIRLEALC